MHLIPSIMGEKSYEYPKLFENIIRLFNIPKELAHDYDTGFNALF